MAVNYAASLKTTRMTAVLNAIDAGAAAGRLKIYTASFATLLADMALNDPCGSVSGDTLTFNASGVSDSSANASGTAAVARIEDSDGNVVVNNLTVGTSGTNIVIGNTSITAGQAVSMTSGSLQHAA